MGSGHGDTEETGSKTAGLESQAIQLAVIFLTATCRHGVGAYSDASGQVRGNCFCLIFTTIQRASSNIDPLELTAAC